MSRCWSSGSPGWPEKKNIFEEKK